MRQIPKRFSLKLPIYSRLWLSVILSGLFMVSCNSLSQAQRASDNSLTHLTSAVRSDGKGQVIRFHLRQQADSFRVYQPRPHMVQVTLFGETISSKNVAVPSHSPAFGKVNFYDIANGVGIDIYLKVENFFNSEIYRDGQTRDILVALSTADKQTLEKETRRRAPIAWEKSIFPPPERPAASPETSGKDNNSNGSNDTEYRKAKGKIAFDTVVLDPGHGGHDTGALGYRNLREKDIVLEIAKKVGGYLNEYLPDINVIYTRDDDKFIELEERGSIANRNEGDLFVSIHANSSRSRQPYGSEVYFLGLERSKTALEVMKRENMVVRANSSDEQKELSQKELLIYELANSGYISSSERIAGMIEHQFDDRAQRRSRGVKQARFVVLYHASMPAVLIETGFISNQNEGKYLATDYGQSIIASAIFRAIRNYKEQFEKSQHLKTK